MKYFANIVLGILAVCICDSFAQSHSVTWGNIGNQDTLIAHDVVIKRSNLMQRLSEEYVFPKNGQINFKTITGIRVKDQYTNGIGGFAKLSKGGPGNKNVVIQLTSQRSHGYHFIIDIYGQ